MNEELLNQYMVVERIIANQISTGNLSEYFIKWNGLPYSEWYRNFLYLLLPFIFIVIIIIKYLGRWGTRETRIFEQNTGIPGASGIRYTACEDLSSTHPYADIVLASSLIFRLLERDQNFKNWSKFPLFFVFLIQTLN